MIIVLVTTDLHPEVLMPLNRVKDGFDGLVSYKSVVVLSDDTLASYDCISFLYM